MFLEKGRGGATTAYALRKASTAQIVASTVELALTRAARRRGLLGRDGVEPGHAMLIAPCSSIHTWFMRFPIDLVFATRDGRVLKTCAAMPAWRMAIGWGAYAAVELPIGTIAQSNLKAGDRLELV